MQSLWNDDESLAFGDDPLGLRVYTSRLLGREPDLVLHGGGNTSVKTIETDFLGRSHEVLHIKGSGWDLETIDRGGFAAVRMETLLALACLETLSDTDMVREQRAAMLHPDSPTPSVEAILHAIIPFRYVDHTHADALVTISNSPGGEKILEDLYGPALLRVPYVMPGFALARHVFEMTRDIDWKKLSGIVLMRHGVFTFDDDARASYENTIALANRAEKHLAQHAQISLPIPPEKSIDLQKLASLRRAASRERGSPCLVHLDASDTARSFSGHPHAAEIATRGPLTPDHVLRTKRIPVIVGDDPAADVARFADAYRRYFSEHRSGTLAPLDPAPRWAVWPGVGTAALGRDPGECRVIGDIARHTCRAILQAEALGGWRALGARELFDIEYWELEQAKLKKTARPPAFAGKIVLISGAAGGIGRACAETFLNQGAAVIGLDIDPTIEKAFSHPAFLGLRCDLTDDPAIRRAVHAGVRAFGGLDILISNAGAFPPSRKIEQMEPALWEQSIRLNLTSHQRLLSEAIPWLSLGVEPAAIVIGSKNVPAPGPGAATYSVAKAGLTQLARVAALELGERDIRVNVIHPNNVFDTAIWTDEVLKSRAAHYGMSVEEYRTNNLLKREVKSADVAALACCLAGPAFALTTGAQIPIDGGNDRVI